MKKRDFLALGDAALAAASTTTRAETPANPQGPRPMTPTDSGYAPINGMEMHFEVHGTGKPLVLLPSHAASFYELLGGGLKDADWDGKNMVPSRLTILPGLTHYTVFVAPVLAETALAFLDGAGSPQEWSAAKRAPPRPLVTSAPIRKC